jgi:hypothetical protein
VSRAVVSSVAVSAAVPRRVLSPYEIRRDAQVWKFPVPVTGRHTKVWNALTMVLCAEVNVLLNVAPGRRLKRRAAVNSRAHAPVVPTRMT